MDWMLTLAGFWLNALALLAGLAVAFGVAVRLMPCNPGMYWWMDLRATVADLVYWFVVPLFSRLCRMLLLIAAVGLVFGGREPSGFPVRELPLWAQCVIILLLQDVMMYWMHRAFHTRFAWRFHAVHHSPTVLDWLSTVRFHPINTFLEFTVADVVVLLLGFSPQALLVLAPFNIVYSAMVHANLNWTFGPLRFVFASPVFHRWHHTREQEGRNRNFAPTFPFLDLAFGTFFMPPGRLPVEFGVGEADFPRGFWGQLIYPFRKYEMPGTSRARRQPAAIMVTGVLLLVCLAGAGVYYRSWQAARLAPPAHPNLPAAARAAEPGPAVVIRPRPAADLPGSLAASALTISGDGRRVVLGQKGGTLKICDAATGEEQALLAGHTGRVNGLAVSGDDRVIISGSFDGTVRVWDAATGREKATLSGHKGMVLSVAASGDGRVVVSGSTDGTVRVWDAATGHELASFTGQTDAFPAVAVSADGGRIVAADLATVHVWDGRTAREELTLKGHADLVFCVAISPDGRRIVSGSLDGTLRVWDGRTGREERTLKGHSGSVFCVALTPDGRRIVSGSNDGTVRAWDADTGREELTLTADVDPITSVAVSADGRRIVSATRAGTVRVWDAEPGQPLNIQ
jgi:sterol desaturase/sphingolipid hydroxylase (fatty acid hydroxylase superfamily)/outer membrane protein assembly factor BamB